MEEEDLMKKGIIVTLILVIILIAPTGVRAVSNIATYLDAINEVFDLIYSNHLKEVNPEVLMRGAIDGMIATLNDPYTEYFSQEELTSFTNSIEQSFVGIGIVLDEREGKFFIQEVISNSPAYQAGLKVEDEILKVDEIALQGKSLEQVISLIRGVEGSEVKLTIKREGMEREFTLTRQKIQLPNIETTLLNDQIGMIKLYSFSSNAPEEMKLALQSLKSQGMKGLILDLRGNGGGYLQAAEEIIRLFIKEGVLTRLYDRNGQTESITFSGGTEFQQPLVILVDHNTASAAELLTIALKDYNKAYVIGTTTFGKGVVQYLVPVEATNGVLKITVEEYRSPLGKKVQGVGVEPNLKIEDQKKQLEAAKLYLEGNDPLSLLKELTFKVDGKEVIQKNNNFYLHVRSLVNQYNGAVEWIEAKRSIKLTFAGISHEFVSSNVKELILLNGSSYINADILTKYYPQFIVTVQQENGETVVKVTIR